MTDISKTISSLKKNNFDVYHVKNKKEAKEIFFKEIFPEINPKTVSYGDSLSAESTGILEDLKKMEGINFIETFDENATQKEQIQASKDALHVDLFIAGSNAVTTTGLLVNLDMVGNRIAGIVFGPRRVVLVIGKNKITENLEGAMERVRSIAPKNAARHPELNLPCQKTGECIDCSSPKRICNSWLISEKSYPKGRIKIILVEGDLGL
ncbi:MAG: lactate utilization protein [Bacillota bacterium]|nr:lactate utilization protein [Bacillota bacterium]